MNAHRRCALFLLVTFFAGFSPDPLEAGRKKKKKQAETAEDLQVVACKLPGQIRNLGRRASYVTARRLVRTTAIDCRIRGGEYTAYDRSSYAASLQVWLGEAKAGDAEAQTYVGEIFEKGLTGIPDYTSAVKWYRDAAAQGFTRAQINLANLYEKGLGVPQDSEKALELYRLSAGIDAAIVLDWREEEAALRREMGDLRAELDAVKQELAGARDKLDAAEAELRDLRRQLEKARQAGEDAAALEAAVSQRQEEVDAARVAVERFRQRLSQLSAMESGEIAGPSLSIVEPEVLVTRGPTLVPVPAGTGRLALSGQVTAPAGLAGLTVDGKPSTPDARGFFRAEIAYDAQREILIEARDQRDRKVSVQLVLNPAGTTVGNTAATPPPRAAPPPGKARSTKANPNLHALVIAASGYRHLPALQTAAADGREVARQLEERYGFNVRLLSDPTHFDILFALGDLRDNLKEEDRLIVYYAGHGKIDGRRGYWIGVDGAADDPELWVPNEAITDLVDVIPARHVLVVSDSCYSGTLTGSAVPRLAGSDDLAARLNELNASRSRTVLTSGGLQPVLDSGGGDHSLFAGAFLRVLELNRGVLSGAELHREVSSRVRLRALALGVRQSPAYAPIQHAGHEAGDFVFEPRL